MDQPTKIPYTGQLHPPFSDTTTLMAPASFGTKLKKIFAGLVAAGIVGGILMAGGHKEHWPWLFYTGAGIGLLIFGATFWQAIKAQTSKCPYCNAELGSTTAITLNPADENEQVECPNCFEWLISHQATLRAFKNEDTGDKKEFSCPVFERAQWPQECITCGAPPVRFLEAKKTKLELGKLLVGRLSVSWGSINNVPYCGAHGGDVSLEIKDGILRAVFTDYDARRRYLCSNPVRVPLKKK